jgi:ubiquinone/menaquinone biosynthesis C-methylase UbiE
MTTRPPGPLSVSEPWELVAGGYATDAIAIMAPFAARAAELAGLGPESVVLDVATGPGTLALAVAARVKKVHALDFSPAMLAELERAASASGLSNVEAVVGDGQALPFPERMFDAAFSMFGLMFFPDRPQGFRELWRVLKPGGIAVVSSWAPVDESTLMQLMFGAIRAADPSRPAPAKDLLSLENSELFQQELETAGFEQVRIHTHQADFRVDAGGDELWERISRSSAPLVLMRKRLGEEAWQKQAAIAREYVRNELASGVTSLGTKAFLGVGYKPA